MSEDWLDTVGKAFVAFLILVAAILIIYGVIYVSILFFQWIGAL